MKLLEIIDTRISKHFVDDMRTIRPTPPSASGSNREVWDNDEWSINRLSSRERLNTSLDAFMLYALLLKKYNLAESNPFFPRIYDIKIYYDNENKKSLKYNIEKLEDLHRLSWEDVRIIYQNIFQKDYELKSPRDFSLKEAEIGFIVDQIGYRIDNRGQPTLIKNKKLIEACDFIKKIMIKYKRQNDITEQNIMFRRTARGAQLVITDPLF